MGENEVVKERVSGQGLCASKVWKGSATLQGCSKFSKRSAKNLHFQ
jgi:hypothetical protein